MFEHYKPTEEEIESVQYKVFLTSQPEDISDQNALIGVLVRAILNFDYHYHYSDSHDCWVGGREKETWIRERISEVEHPQIREHLSQCFNPIHCKDVVKPFTWGKYVYNITKYQHYRFEGLTHERACYGVGLLNWLNNISYSIDRCGAAYRAVYADNIPLASTLLREGYRWFNGDDIKPICVTESLYKELILLGGLYKQKIIRYQDLKEFLGVKVNLMFDQKVEVLLINNFYMIFSY